MAIKRVFSVLVLALVCGVPVSSDADATTDLELSVDGDSRYFDLFRVAWMEVGAVDERDPSYDGFFHIQDEPGYGGAWDQFAFDPMTFNPTAYVELGGGGDAFPNEPVFSPNYSVTWDDTGITGIGLESAPVLSLNLDFADDINIWADTWSVGSLDGGSSVTLLDGFVIGVDGGADITTMINIGGTNYAYDGGIDFSGNSWSLYIDDTEFVIAAASDWRNVWDLHGTFAAIPEPSSVLFVGVVMGVPAVRRRRR